MKRRVDRTYLGSIVLGLNDALVELTGVLAGLTLALQNSEIILINAILVITGYTYYASREKGESFSRKFFEMLAISMGVAIISFGMGYLVRLFVGVGV
jgi:VIT1/CCC1 family predicted Fe2+/Mn2+ transporter